MIDGESALRAGSGEEEEKVERRQNFFMGIPRWEQTDRQTNNCSSSCVQIEMSSEYVKVPDSVCVTGNNEGMRKSRLWEESVIILMCCSNMKGNENILFQALWGRCCFWTTTTLSGGWFHLLKT